jgi:hypothetical protein
MKRLFTIGGISLALLLSGCATDPTASGSSDVAAHLERQDITQELSRSGG